MIIGRGRTHNLVALFPGSDLGQDQTWVRVRRYMAKLGRSLGTRLMLLSKHRVQGLPPKFKVNMTTGFCSSIILCRDIKKYVETVSSDSTQNLHLQLYANVSLQKFMPLLENCLLPLST